MTDQEFRERLERLVEDEAFKRLIKRVEDAQVAVFRNAQSSPEKREEAHTIVRALAAIDGQIQAIRNEGVVAARGQHRGND